MKPKTQSIHFLILFTGIGLGVLSFILGANLTFDNPLKHDLILLIGLGELMVIYSIVSILINNKK